MTIEELRAEAAKRDAKAAEKTKEDKKAVRKKNLSTIMTAIAIMSIIDDITKR